MNLMEFLIAISFFLVGFLSYYLFHRIRVGRFEKLAEQILHNAEVEADQRKALSEIAFKEQQLAQTKECERTWQSERKKICQEADRLKQREDRLEERMGVVEKKLVDLEKRESLLLQQKNALSNEKISIEQLQKELQVQLEKLATITSKEAKELLLKNIQAELKNETAHFIRKAQEESERNAEANANKILSTCMNRLAASTVSDVTCCMVALPTDEIKGRIIGREGRNIRALEKATGVNFLMDDTPQAIVISSFDPLRRAIAKHALTELVLDGRIHPTRIEEAVEKATQQIQKMTIQAGEDAALKIGAFNMHPELMLLIGKLKFRYSLGQNVLDHSLEVAHLMGLMAGELGLNVPMAKRIGLLHDVGKALSHEIPGTHALIGHDLALKYGESKEVANGIGCHHFEMDPLTIEASLCNTADTLSAARPGGRVEAIEEYIKRLSRLEEIALEFSGVEKAYALQAGREVRVIALPDQLSDDDLLHLARNITKRIEAELHYPSKIKVTVLREKRVINYAM